jgi:transposase
MAGKRKQHSAAFKAQVALAAHKGDRTVNELASQFGVHPTLIHGWKKQLLTQAETLLANGSKVTADTEVEKAELFEQIGRLKMELEWLKGKRGILFRLADTQLGVKGQRGEKECLGQAEGPPGGLAKESTFLSSSLLKKGL